MQSILYHRSMRLMPTKSRFWKFMISNAFLLLQLNYFQFCLFEVLVCGWGSWVPWHLVTSWQHEWWRTILKVKYDFWFLKNVNLQHFLRITSCINIQTLSLLTDNSFFILVIALHRTLHFDFGFVQNFLSAATNDRERERERESQASEGQASTGIPCRSGRP